MPVTAKKDEERPVQDGPGRFSYEGIDRLMHEKARLGIMTSLLAHPRGLPFTELKELCSLTDGNLSRHLQILQQAGLVEIRKGYEGRRPQTRCRLSTEGRARFLDYIAELERVIRDAAPARFRERAATTRLLPSSGGG
jgi:DNA-binding transcriptional ArsR family regulator